MVNAHVCYKRHVSDLPERCDVVIVGAGFAGAATASALARRGVTDVVVLERETELGRYASGRSAGLGRQLAEDDDTTVLTVRGAQLLRDRASWTHTGGLLSFDDIAQADEYVARAARFDVGVDVVERDAVLARWPQLDELRIARALFVPSDGTIDVAALLRELAADARVELGTGVVTVEPGPRIVTNRGAIAARVVVDAAGPWAGVAAGAPAVKSFKRHVFQLELAAAEAMPWVWHLGRGEMYVRAISDGALVSPCDKSPCEPGDQQPDPVGEAQFAVLIDNAAPALAGVPIARRWACQRAFTEDRKMKLGRDPDRPWLVWAAGLGGHGATASLAVGERVAEAVVAALA